MPTRTIIILTLNEVEGVRWLLSDGPNLFEVADEVVAVDGGSTDGTRELIESANIRVIDQEKSGRGEAFRVGVKSTRGDHLVFFSPDGNEDPGDIPRIFDLLRRGKDIAIASRFLRGSRNEEDGRIFPLRKWANQLFTIAANQIWNRKDHVSDAINGFRGISRIAFYRICPSSMGYTIEYEMTIRAMQQCMEIGEISTVEGERRGGQTKAPSLSTGLLFMGLLFKEVFSSSTIGLRGSV